MIARVVPFDGKISVLATRWVDGDGVILPERVEEVGGVVGGKELDTKVVYSEGEGGVQGCMGPNTGGGAPQECSRGVGGCVQGACRQ